MCTRQNTGGGSRKTASSQIGSGGGSGGPRRRVRGGIGGRPGWNRDPPDATGGIGRATTSGCVIQPGTEPLIEAGINGSFSVGPVSERVANRLAGVVGLESFWQAKKAGRHGDGKTKSKSECVSHDASWQE